MNMRPIRSWVIRKGRMTDGQRRAMALHWPRYGLEVGDEPVDLAAAFERPGPVTVEIGFGMGDSLFEMASGDPGTHFVGVEVHLPGVGHLLLKAAEAGLDNLKVFNADGVEVLRRSIAPASVDTFLVFFPDPWHKKKHHKRRLVNREFADLLVDRLKVGGCLHIATDWVPYAEWIREVMQDVPGIEATTPPPRPQTKYERRGLGLGHEVTDLAFRRTG